MLSKSFKVFGQTLILMMIFGLLGGCAQSEPTSAQGDLTANQAAEIIYNDLTYHGISVQKINVSSLTFTDSNTAEALTAIITADGNTANQKVILKKAASGQWGISDHQH